MKYDVLFREKEIREQAPQEALEVLSREMCSLPHPVSSTTTYLEAKAQIAELTKADTFNLWVRCKNLYDAFTWKLVGEKDINKPLDYEEDNRADGQVFRICVLGAQKLTSASLSVTPADGFRFAQLTGRAELQQKKLLSRKRNRPVELPLFTQGDLKKFNLSVAGEQLVMELYDDDLFTLADVQGFFKYINDFPPSLEEVTKVENLVRTARSDKQIAVLLKLRIGGVHVMQNMAVKEYFQPVKDVGLLSESILFQDVPLLAIYSARPGLPMTYDYIGRRIFSELHGQALKLTKSCTLLLTGASGSGKSTVFSTLASFLYSTGKHVVLYLIGSVVIYNPLNAIKNALLLAYAEDGQKQLEIDGLSSNALLCDWCTRSKDIWMVFIDDYNALDSLKSPEDVTKQESRDAARELITSCFSNHKLFICSSWLGDATAYYGKKHKENMRFVLHSSPYSVTEVGIWKWWQERKQVEGILQKPVLDINSPSFEYYTGYVPRLAAYYVQAASLDAFVSLYLAEFTAPLWLWIKKLTRAEVLEFEKLLAGTLCAAELPRAHAIIKQISKMTYETMGGQLQMYSMYIADWAFRCLLGRKDELKLHQQLLNISVWEDAIRTDMKMKAYNPARVGWNAEAVTVGIIELHGVRQLDLTFSTSRRYCTKGSDNLRTLSAKDKQAGVLFIPSAFNEECVDLVHAMYDKDGWSLVGLQISIASWKNKKKQDSDRTWAHVDMHACWVPQREKIKKSRFVYIMRKGELQQSQLKEKVVRTARSGETEIAVAMQVEFVAFGGVHPELEFLDEIGEIEEPKPFVKAEMVNCGALTLKGLPCKNVVSIPKTLCHCHEEAVDKGIS